MILKKKNGGKENHLEDGGKTKKLKEINLNLHRKTNKTLKEVSYCLVNYILKTLEIQSK
jgi:hypothetical protein